MTPFASGSRRSLRGLNESLRCAEAGDRKKRRSGFVFRCPRLEQLEDRVCPSQTIYLGTDLAFQVMDAFTQSGGSTYSYMASSSEPILIAPFSASSFSAVLELTSGTFSADTSLSTNPNEEFSVTQAIFHTVPGGTAPNIDLNNEQDFTNVQAKNFLNGGLTLANPLTISPGPFTFSINSVGMRMDGHDGDTGIALQGFMELSLGPTQLTLAVSFMNYLYIDPKFTYGFDFSGGSLTVATSFTAFDVTFAGTVTADFEFGNTGNTLKEVSLYGGVSVKTSMAEDANYNLDFMASMGTSESDPGLEFQNGSLTALNVMFTGGLGANPNDVTLGGLGIVLNGLGMTYSAAKDEFGIYGGLGIKLAGATFSAKLGDSMSPGLVVLDGVVNFTAAQFSLSDFSLGSELGIQKFVLKYSDSDGTTSLTIRANVLFFGATLDGNFSLTYTEASGWTLQSIGVSANDPTGLPIIDGIELTYLSGEFNNIAGPNWSITASATIAFGTAVPVGTDNENAYIALATGTIQINENEVVLSADVTFGAVVNENGAVTKVLVGSATGTVTLDWAEQLYELQVQGSFYAGIFNFDGTIRYFNDELFVLATATINVPSFVPIIGGDELAGAGFAFEYNFSSSTGFFAAWVSLKLVGEIGIEYDLDGSIKIIGKSTIEGIVNMQPPAPGSGGLPNLQYAYSYDFTIASYSSANDGNNLSLDVRWQRYNTTFFVQVNQADGTIATAYSGTVTPSGSYPTDYSYTYLDPSSLNVKVPKNQYVAGVSITDSVGFRMPPGTYMLTLFSAIPLDPAAIEWDSYVTFATPSADAPVLDDSKIESFVADQVSIDKALRNHPSVTLYFDATNSGYHGAKIADLQQDTLDNQLFILDKQSFESVIGTLPPGTYYFYTVVDDGINPLVESPYSDAFTVPFGDQVTGTVLDTGDGRAAGLSGFTVFLDLKNDGKLDPGDPSALTNAAGQYTFDPGNSISTGQAYAVDVIPSQAGFDGNTRQQFEASGGINYVNFDLQQVVTISGTVTDQDTQQGLAGITVYLDLNDNGQLDYGIDSNGQSVPIEPTAKTDSKGDYQFVGLAEDFPYEVRYVLPPGYLPPTSGNASATVTTGDDAYALTSGVDLTALPGASIVGSVMESQLSFGSQTPEPVPEAGVTIMAKNTSSGQSTPGTTDADGNYIIQGLPAGTYDVSESVPSQDTQVSPFQTTDSFTVAEISNDQRISAVAAGDFNGDGELDYAEFIQSGGEILWFPGKGDGTFGAPNKVDTGLPTSSNDMQVGDFNGDGYPDLLILGTDQKVYIVYGSSKGLGTSATMVFDPASVLGETTTDGKVIAFTLNGMATGGNFESQQTANFLLLGHQADDFVVYGWEVSKDSGDSNETARYVVYALLASKSFAVNSQYATYSSGSEVAATAKLPSVGDHAVAIGDLNNDGYLDLYMNFWAINGGSVGNEPDTMVDTVAYGHGDGFFGHLRYFQNTFQQDEDFDFNVPGNGGPVALADFTGNDVLGAVALDRDSSGLSSNAYVYQQTGFGEWVDLTGAFVSPSSPGLALNANFETRQFIVPQIALIDTDGDGLPDIVIPEDQTGSFEAQSGQVLILYNQYNAKAPPVNGLAQFDTSHFLFKVLDPGSSYFYPYNATPDSLATGDFLDNGQNDLLLGDASFANTGATWLLTNTSDQVLTPQVVTAGSGTQATINFGNLEVSKFAGTIYQPTYGNTALAASSTGIAGAIVYFDLKQDDKLDPGDPFVVTNSLGQYTINSLPPDVMATLRVLLPSQDQSSLTPGYAITGGSAGVTYDFAVQTHLLAPVDDVTLRVGASLQVPLGLTTSALATPKILTNHLVFTLLSGPAGLTIDAASGVIQWANAPIGSYAVTAAVRDYLNPAIIDQQSFTVSVVSANSSFISNLYLALLDRPADPSGLAYWLAQVNGGASRALVVLEIENDPSNEFRNDEVNRIYEKYLHRSALSDQAGLKYWAAALQGGMTVEEVSAAIVDSPEYLQHSTGTFNSWLDDFYEDVFQRTVDASSRAYWDSVAESGVGLSQIALDIFHAPPLTGQQGNEYQIDLVNGFYTDFLGRTSRGDPGADYWLSQMQQGVTDEAIAASILASPEFFAKPAAS